MKKHYCDRCGKEIEVNNYDKKNAFELYCYGNKGHTKDYNKEYCKECYKGVFEHLKLWFGEK